MDQPESSDIGEDDLRVSKFPLSMSALSPSQPFMLFLLFRADSELARTFESDSLLGPGNSKTFLSGGLM